MTTEASTSRRSARGLLVSLSLILASVGAGSQPAAAAASCTRGALVKAQHATSSPVTWYEHRCVRGAAVLSGGLDDTAASVFVLFRKIDGRWVQQSSRTGRTLTPSLATGTWLSKKEFAQRFGSVGWPYRVTTPTQIRNFLLDDEFGTIPERIESASMWLSGFSLDNYSAAIYDLGMFSQPFAKIGKCRHYGSPGYTCWIDVRQPNGVVRFGIQINAALTKVQFVFGGG